MILINVIHRLESAIVKANDSKESQEVTFLYNDLLTYDTISSVFDWLFRQSVDFSTKHGVVRFIVTIHPQQ